MATITINRKLTNPNQGPGKDYISGLLFFTNTLPSGFGTSDRCKQILSVADAESKGILGDFSDGTGAVGVITISHLGGLGDSALVKVVEPDKTVTLCNAVMASTDTTIALACTNIKNAINALTYSHGYTAVSDATTVTITAPKRLGIFLNTNTPLSITITQTLGLAGSVTTPFASGVASIMAQFHYHISEYFRLYPAAPVWVYFAPITANAWDFAELITMQNSSNANGELRQVGIFLGNCGTAGSGNGTAAWIKTVADACQTQKITLDGFHKNLSIIFSTDIHNISDLTTLQDTTTYSDFAVTASISQGGWLNSTVNPVTDPGWLLYKSYGYTIGTIGADLGTIASSPVNQDQGWVSGYPQSDGINLAQPAFGNGHVIDIEADATLLSLLARESYKFNTYYQGFPNNYWNDNPTCISTTSAFAWINNNRVFDKSARLLYNAFVPILNGDIQLNSDGTPTSVSLGIWQSIISNALKPMTTRQPGNDVAELAGYTVTIDPLQNILTSNNMVIGVENLLQGIARNIIINLSNN